MTIFEKLDAIFDIRLSIRQAIIDMGVELPTNIPFAEYPHKILQIRAGDTNIIFRGN